MNINKAIIYGNLTRDPEMKSLPSGTAVTSFSLATNRSYKDKNGQKQDTTEYHNIVTFNKTAENVHKYLHKGDSAYVEGRMQTRSWEQDGQKKYRTEVIAESVQFGPKRSGGEGSYSAGAQQSSPKTEDTSSQDSGPAIDYPEEEINPEDIPF